MHASHASPLIPQPSQQLPPPLYFYLFHSHSASQFWCLSQISVHQPAANRTLSSPVFYIEQKCRTARCGLFERLFGWTNQRMSWIRCFLHSGRETRQERSNFKHAYFFKSSLARLLTIGSYEFREWLSEIASISVPISDASCKDQGPSHPSAVLSHPENPFDDPNL
ncbi:hypothetical protein K440DRAFT_319521 [Wilcoxina mikolae CBS 423.85]|nr:hypothetical protein K440DRAFT_319521 [Wilcoxina mikolae CBS 423.85]